MTRTPQTGSPAVTARTEHGIFVAIARHMLGDGWTTNRCWNWPQRLQIRWIPDDVRQPGQEQRLTVDRLTERGVAGERILDVTIDTVGDAVVPLAKLGILPR